MRRPSIWKADPAEAMAFQTEREARDYAQRQKLEEVQVADMERLEDTRLGEGR